MSGDVCCVFGLKGLRLRMSMLLNMIVVCNWSQCSGSCVSVLIEYQSECHVHYSHLEIKCFGLCLSIGHDSVMGCTCCIYYIHVV